MEKFRLPRNVLPLNYALNFDIDLKKFVFIGEEEIDLKIQKSTNEIVLNSSALEIGSAKLLIKKKEMNGKIRLDEKNERMFLKFDKKVKGLAKLLIKFQGKFTDSLLGFYRSGYKDKSGNQKYLVTTQFEAPYARRAFPCFDEPEFKATFEVSMKVDRKLLAISNMPIKKESSEGNKKIFKFHKTPLMSTYLLYLGTGEFEFLTNKLGKTLVRIVTTKGKRKQGQFALEIAKKVLSFFENYSGIKYPLPKLDLIAIPDFVVGAMENWGAITFREVGLLSDSKSTSASTRLYIAMVIAHEIWHQWSGDLVTMRWWDDIWLNESFATFMSYMAVDKLFPEWNMWEDFVMDETIRALDEDALKTTHPIHMDIQNPKTIEEIFDAISYNKGGSVLRMVENYLGEDVFRKGISSYLSKYKYQNATSEDLWNSLAKVSGKPIKKIMFTWLHQPGYPIIEISDNHKNIFLSQQKFVFDQNDKKKIWPIPFSIKFSDNTHLYKLLEKKNEHIDLKHDERWMKANLMQTGFYRVKYSEKNLYQLKHLIYNKFLSPLDRWGIENDLFALCFLNQVGVANYLKFIKAYKTDDNYLVLTDLVLNLRRIYFVFFDELSKENIWPKFKEYFKDPFIKIVNRFGWEPKENEDHRISLLRELALLFLVFIEDDTIINTALEKFRDHFKKKIALNPNVIRPIFYAAALKGNKKEHDELLKIYDRATNIEERLDVLSAMGRFKEPSLLMKTLNFSLSNKVRLQDVSTAISSVASNPYSRKILFDWMEKNWKKIETLKRNASPIFLRITEAFITAYVGNDYERKLRRFFKLHPVEYKILINKSFEEMRRDTFWFDKNKDAVMQYFSK